MYVAPLATRKDRELLATVASFAGFTNRQNVPGRQPAAGLSSSALLAALSLYLPGYILLKCAKLLSLHFIVNIIR